MHWIPLSATLAPTEQVRKGGAVGFDVTANLIGAAIALLLGAVMLCAAALSLSARFFRAVDRHPRRALDHLRAGKDTWLFVEEGDALDDLEQFLLAAWVEAKSRLVQEHHFGVPQ